MKKGLKFAIALLVIFVLALTLVLSAQIALITDPSHLPDDIHTTISTANGDERTLDELVNEDYFSNQYAGTCDDIEYEGITGYAPSHQRGPCTVVRPNAP